MNNIDRFRKDSYDLTFLRFKKYPTDSPTCRQSEGRFRKALKEGRRNSGLELTDPLFSGHKVVRVVKADVVGPSDWFGKEKIFRRKTILVKNPDPHTTPETVVALHVGATTGLVNIGRKLFIAVPEPTGFRIQRPVMSNKEERDIRRLIKEKFPFF
ncbi:MAG: hypothetical protein UT63_C0007G0025 [Candidatus Gottesmanbacteria bacterium GW2011_GWC2_39_8]|uniref:Uncharacterized protein n=1 Tax=Candidatus Gottesmanbacteria bacterium GW2011_GWC2_39_8 TaxID=1618450 RepID=A0A0G0SH65_9BACT|nr:MAG: hypothetical protein UT63_C0007G0025 [Candidatus Gottesmanbacteria bacterium GW2011_GWC2_39_8]